MDLRLAPSLLADEVVEKVVSVQLPPSLLKKL